MKKILWACAALFLTAYLIFLSSFSDRFFSWYLGERLGVFVSLEQVSMPSLNRIVFSRVSAGKDKNSHWFTAQNGTIAAPSRKNFSSGIKIHVENLVPDEALRAKAHGFFSWIGGLETQPLKVDTADLLFRRRPGGWHLRVLHAVSALFRIEGAMTVEGDRLRRMNLRLSLSPALTQKCPEKIARQLVHEEGGWRAASLGFGGSTWTLRGSRGPLLQFSGSWGSK